MIADELKMPNIAGEKKKAKKPKQPYVQQDTARSKATAKLLIALSEGEVEGSGSGLLSDRDIYLDGVPIRNPDRSVNYNVKWEFRKGSIDQDYIPALPVIESENTVGFHVKQSTPFTRTITNDQVDSIRIRLSWPQLVNNKSNGDRIGVTVVYAIDLAVGAGSFEEIQRHTLSEKSTSVYERTHSFDLPRSNTGWRFRVRRITPDQTTDMVQDAFSLEAFTEVIDAKLTYPNTALLYLEFDAEQFSDTPKVAVLMKGKVVRVPENYNPESRTYAGVWDGRWKWAYTDNPAWCCMDMIVSDRFGTGQRLTLENVDKWAMYEIARWCDVLVPDGEGGTEPRHTLNVYLNKPQDAWRILGDIASSFNGVSYWNGQQLEMQADMPRDADIIFTRANIIDGTLEYGAIPRKDKYSQILVKFDNPDNEYETDTVAVNDLALTRRFGVSQTQMAAFGCTRFGEAQRRGKWGLASNRFDRTVTFKTGLDGRLPKIGRIFGLADNYLAGASIGGRIGFVGERDGFDGVFLDRDPQAKVGDKLIINLTDGGNETRTITAVNGRGLQVDSPFTDIAAGMQWAIDSDSLAIQYYKVINIAQDSNMQSTISGVEYSSGKFDYVDNGAQFDQRPITQTPAAEQEPPTNLEINQYNYTEQGLSVTNITFSWSPAKNADYYEVEWRKDNLHWINMPRTTLSSVDVEGVYSGAYEFRVRAVSPQEVASSFAVSELKQITGKMGDPPKLAFLRTASKVMGIQLEWGFPAEGAQDAAFVEIHYASAPSDDIANLLGEYSYPTNTHNLMGLAHATELYFKGRIVDRSGNIGAWSDWVHGTSSADSDEILSYLDGQIGGTQLDDFLRGEVGKIDGFEGLLDDLEQDVQAQLAAMQAKLDQLESLEMYDPAESYLEGSMVKFDNIVYLAKQDVPAGTTPPNPAYWENIGGFESVNDIVAALAVRVQVLESSVTDIDGALVAETARTDIMQSKIDDPVKGLDAQSSAVQDLTTRVENTETGLASGSAAITSLTASVATATNNAATAQQAAQNAATLAGNKGEVIFSGTAPAADKRLPQNLWIDTKSGANTPKRWSGSAWVPVTDKAAADAAAAAADALAQVSTKAESSAVQALTTRVEDTESGVTANSEMTTALSASLRGSRADGEKSDALEGWYAQAAYSESITVQTTETEALAERSEKLEVSVGNNSAAVETVSRAQADTSGKLSTMWGVRMRQGTDGKWVTAGIGLGIENVGGVDQSQFIVDANLFAVRNGVNGNQQTVFAVQNGQVIMNSAVIGDATISNAKIANAAITTAKIGNAQITTAKIADLSVDTLQLAGRAVTIPVLSFTKSELMWNTTPHTWKTIQSVSVSATGEPAVILLSAEFFTNLKELWFQVRLLRGSVVVWQSESPKGFRCDDWWSELITVSAGDTPPAGNHTYSFQVYRDRANFDQGRATNRSIVYMELKR